MSSPTALPTDLSGGPALGIDGLWHASFRSMASPVRIQLGSEVGRPQAWHERVRSVFTRVDAECTRFEPSSDLMRANAAGDEWCAVRATCFAALRAAREAHLATGGLFDPRVLRGLVALGYDRTLPFADGVDVGHVADSPRPMSGRWEPRFDEHGLRVSVGPEPVDLGGIGKGLALRWARDELDAGGCSAYLIDAGGDCVFSGPGPDGSGWRVGVEDPRGGVVPVAVLEVLDGACATSSLRLLSWRAGERTVHHLIDPRTGRPGDDSLRSVTVFDTDPATAEVWTKALFLHGDEIAAAAREIGIAALWVSADGTIDMTPDMQQFVIWRRA